MQKLMFIVVLTIALLGAIGLGSAHTLSAAQPVAAAHSQPLVDGTVTPLAQCGGSAPTFC
jgi:hypothetical protein